VEDYDDPTATRRHAGRTLRQRLAALPRGVKVGGAVAAVLAVGAGAWRLLAGPSPGHGHRERAAGAPPPTTAAPPPPPAAPVAVHHGRRHPLGVLLLPHGRPRAPETDPAVRRDLARLLEDVERARLGEPPLAGAEAGAEGDS
jgi:hypothetical protein